MSSIGISNNFKNSYIKRLRGGGSLDYRLDDHIVKTKSPYGTDNGSMIDWSFPVNDGDVIDFEVLARNLSGKPRIAIDYLTIDGYEINVPYVFLDVEGSEFKNYKLQTTVPYGKEIKRARIVLGVWNRVKEVSEGEYTRPLLKVKSSLNSLQTIATGMISLNNGSHHMHKSFKHFGIVDNFDYNSNTKELTVTLENGTDEKTRPIIQVTGTNDSVFIPIAGQWNYKNRQFKLAFTNGTEKIDLNEGNHYVYIEVKA